ncbi:MAG: hypothetical protein FWE58_01080, partial [Methanobrevibacter sp.]|nr:hypothetical protein [Methanobrevibacter sp.]
MVNNEKKIYPKYKKSFLDKIKSSFAKNKIIYIILKEKGNPKKIYGKIKAYQKIESLKLFNEEYYLKKYPEIKKHPINPLNHYIYHGYVERRNPSEKFNGNYYLNFYADVKKSKLNPLVHYVLYGKNEFRFKNKNDELRSPKSLYLNLKKQEKRIKKHKTQIKQQETQIKQQETQIKQQETQIKQQETQIKQ